MSYATPQRPLKTSEEVEVEVQKLASEIEELKVVTMVAGFTGAGVGSILTIPLGPVAFVVGSALGAIAAGGLRLYSQEKKKNIGEEISSLLEIGAITTEKAAALKAKLNAIYSANPQKQDPPIATTTDESREVDE